MMEPLIIAGLGGLTFAQLETGGLITAAQRNVFVNWAANFWILDADTQRFNLLMINLLKNQPLYHKAMVFFIHGLPLRIVARYVLQVGMYQQMQNGQC